MADLETKSRLPKLAEVARAAGVSLGTASNVFNRPELVRLEVRELVVAAARTLGYGGPDPKGRLLMGGKAGAIGVVPPGRISISTSFRSAYFRELLSGIGEVCEEHRSNMLLFSGSDADKQQAIRNAVVDGFILGHVEEVGLMAVRQRRVPFVVMDMDAAEDVNSVRIAARIGARLAAQHLLALGHRRIAILGVLREPITAVFHPAGVASRLLIPGYPLDAEKIEGYAEAFTEAGLSIADMPIVQSYIATPLVEEGARLLMEAAPGVTAVLAMTDTLAIALLGEARRRGVDVPGALSIVGFDDVPDAAATVPPLTTVAQPIAEKGRIAARLVFAGETGRHEVLPVKLVERASTAPPKVDPAGTSGG